MQIIKSTGDLKIPDLNENWKLEIYSTVLKMLWQADTEIQIGTLQGECGSVMLM
jgi:hypothetical protein